MTLLGVAVRWLQLASALSLIGVFTLALLAGRSDRPTARAWETRVLSLSRWIIVVLLASGLGALSYQAAVVTGRTSALLDPAAWLRLLLHSRFGTVWMISYCFLLLLAALMLLREREASAADWIAWRAEAWALAVAAAAAMAWAGHAAAVEPWGLVAAAADAVHIAVAGAWLGGLWPLALLLRAASREKGADARPFAVLATRRFSAFALVGMLIVIGTGLWNAWVQVASVPALVGTRYGWLLLVKMGLLLPILGLAAANRSRLPALSGEAATVGRPAMARLSRFVGWELGLALSILAVTSGLTLTAPALHDSPHWPFAHRLSYDAMADVPGVKARLLIGSQIAILGLLGLILGVLVKRRRALIASAGTGVIVVGLWVALPPLAVDAYPTTYLRPAVPYEVTSIDSGMTLFANHCGICHGRSGVGDGPGGAGLPRPPADLTAPHTGQHTAGDLFWWLTHGIPASGMPPFGGMLSQDERWDLINFVRALSAGQQVRILGPVIEPGGARLAAPDFTFAVGPSPARSLKDLRGTSLLLVFFSLPESRARLTQLGEVYGELQFLGTEIIAVPMDADPRILTRLGGDPPILFPVVTDGAAEIIPTYMLFRRGLGPDGLRPEPPMPRHMELLIDRQGYIRARWIPRPDRGPVPGQAPRGPGAWRGAGWSDLDLLRTEVASLDLEAPAEPPEEHVH